MANKIKIDPKLLNVAWALGTSYKIAINEGVVREVGNNRSPNPAQVNELSFTTFSTRPEFESRTPAYNTTGSFVVTPTFTANREVSLNSTVYNFYVYERPQVGSDILVATIPINGGRVSIANNTVTLNLLDIIDSEKDYYISADEGVIVDMFNFKNINTTTYLLNYSTGKISLDSVVPIYGTTGSFTTTAVISFDRDIKKGTGQIRLYEKTQGGDVLIDTFNTSSSRITIQNGNVVIDLLDKVNSNRQYYLSSDPKFVIDNSVNFSTEQMDDTNFKYSTGLPLIQQVNPLNNTTASYVIQPSIDYVRRIKKGAGSIRVYKDLISEPDELLEEIPASSNKITISDSQNGQEDLVSIDLTDMLEGSSTYYLSSDNNFIIDWSNNFDVETVSENNFKYTTGLGPEFTSVGFESFIPWDITKATYAENRNIALVDLDPHGIFFKPDGTKMYVVGEMNDSIFEFNLSKPWLVSTAVLTRDLDVSATGDTPKCIFFKPDGTKFYITGYSPGNVKEYNLSTPWDISTGVYFQTFTYSIAGSAPTGIFFKPDGTKMYILSDGLNRIREYNLSTPWNILSIPEIAPVDGFYTGTINSPTGIFFKSDGTKMYMIGRDSTVVQEYNLTTAWDITTLTYLQSKSIVEQNTDMVGIFFNPDGTNMFLAGKNQDFVYSYILKGIRKVSFPFTEEVEDFISSIEINFNKEIVSGKNNVMVFNGEGLFRTIPVTSSSFSTLNTNSVGILLYNEPIPEDDYHIRLDRGVVKDLDGLISHRIDDETLMDWSSLSLTNIIENRPYNSRFSYDFFQSNTPVIIDQDPILDIQYTLTLTASSGTFTAPVGSTIGNVWTYTTSRVSLNNIINQIEFDADVNDMNWDLPYTIQMSKKGVEIVNKTRTMIGLPYDTTLTLVSNTYTNSVGSSTTFTVVANTNSSITTPVEFKTQSLFIGTATFVNNQATITIPPGTFAAGNYNIFADWNGQTYVPKFNGTDSNTILQTMLTPAPTQVSLAISTSTYYVRQEVGSGTNVLPVITATISGSYPTHEATGQVRFQDSTLVLGTSTVTVGVPNSSATFTWDPVAANQVDRPQRTLYGYYLGDNWNNGSSAARSFQAYLRNSATIQLSMPSVDIYRPFAFTVTSEVSTVNMNDKTISWYNDNNLVTNTNFVNRLSSVTFDSMAITTGSHSVKVTFAGDYNFSPITNTITYNILKQTPLFTLQRNSPQVPLFASTDTFTFSVQPELNGKTITYYDEYSNFTGTTVVSNGTATFVASFTTSTTYDPVWQSSGSGTVPAFLHRIRASITGTDVYADRTISLAFIKQQFVPLEFSYDANDGTFGSVSIKNLERIPNNLRGTLYPSGSGTFIAVYRAQNGSVIASYDIPLINFTKYTLISTTPAWNYMDIECRGFDYQFPVYSNIEITASKNIREITPSGLYFPGNDIPGA